MSSSAENEIRKRILFLYSQLRQTSISSEYWNEQYQEEIKSQYDREQARLGRELQQRLQDIQSKHALLRKNAEDSVTEVVNALGVLAADWTSPKWKSFTEEVAHGNEIDPLTRLVVERSGFGDTKSIPNSVRLGIVKETGVPRPFSMVPALVPLTGYKHILIVSKGAAKSKALRLLQSVVTRVAVTFPVSSAKFVFVDPLGLGDNFPFKRLPESIRGNTVYSESDEIRVQLRELTEHLRRVTLRYLAREYDNIEAYNRDAEEVVEPYRFLCLADFPAKFDADAATRLLSIAEKGVRTGVYLLMHVHLDSAMPRDFDFESLKRTANVITATNEQFTFLLADQTYSFIPDDIPSSDLFNNLLDQVNKQSKSELFKGIPFSKIAPPRSKWWEGDTKEMIQVPIGRTGARDELMFWLGKREDGRISVHALIGGRTRSGKTTLFHTLIIGLALQYSPDEIELYLLDFKEGVAFNAYAMARLPHARVISIESEREFGLSVLRRLQEELEHRGRLFKDARVEDITRYRQQTGNSLPRIVLIIDEFQRIFVENDVLANRAGLVLEDLARRGGGFGIHLVLGSQSVQIANLAKTTYSQFATRIVLQSFEQDVAALLGPDNVTVANMLERAGEVIYNDDGGRKDRNQPGQVARLVEDALPTILEQINDFARSSERKFQPKHEPIIFRGDQPSDIGDNSPLNQLYDLSDWPSGQETKEILGSKDWIASEKPSIAWIGEAIEIKPHTGVIFRRRGRSNCVVIGDDERTVMGMIGGSLVSLAAFYPPHLVRFRIIDLSVQNENWSDMCTDFQRHFSFLDIRVGFWQEAFEIIDEIASITKQRQQDREQQHNGEEPTIFFILIGAHRLSTLVPVPARLGGRDEPSEHANKLIEIWRRGSEVGVHSMIWCDNAKTFDSYFGRQQLALFSYRIALLMTKDDSQFLLGEPLAGTLQSNRALLQNNERAGILEKFKPYGFPENQGERDNLFKMYGVKLQSRFDGSV